jgi:hypothetical protein
MEHEEFHATLGAGKPIKSNERYCVPGEGTCFSDNAGDAESYPNFGRSDPRKTGKPNYVVEIRHQPHIKQDRRDGYWKTQQSVHPKHVTRIWKTYPDGNKIMAVPHPHPLADKPSS